jgi:hypothetical protein
MNFCNLDRKITECTSFLSISEVKAVVNTTRSCLLRLTLNTILDCLHLARSRCANSNCDIKSCNLVRRPIEYSMSNQIINVNNDCIQVKVFCQIDINLRFQIVIFWVKRASKWICFGQIFELLEQSITCLTTEFVLNLCMMCCVIIKQHFIESLHWFDIFKSKLTVSFRPVLSEKTNDFDHVCEQACVNYTIV